MLCCDDMPTVCCPDIYDSQISKRDVFGKQHVLLDTGAGQSVFKDRNLFYSLKETDQLVIDGVNSDSKPLIISKYGKTDFGMVYYSTDCIANILSFGNIVDDSYHIKYSYKNDTYIVKMTKLGPYYMFSRDKNTNIYIYVT